MYTSQKLTFQKLPVFASFLIFVMQLHNMLNIQLLL